MSYVQVYTGNGKGKTTASLGLSLRAVCAGKKVFMGQFIKTVDYSELKAMDFLPNFEIKRFGKSSFIFGKPTQEDIEAAKNGLRELEKKITSGNYDIVIMDEVNVAIHYNLLNVEEVINVLNNRAKNTEVVLTGRYAKNEIIEYADLVSEIKEVKHYYKTGVQARAGIEK
ncbi:cob(I)alamin adenolsyltransferase/cobinamide ATP-dependent adenolsyltransferase [Tepiditoga spiralis]|uniref:Cob(I)alamin adenolsyltransferase/cobinamide ATP-dependent adenolsyltransferase n=1 Tax=Tepiditoga spiralis TaxID=2108365 RepID=A0A7G1G4V1_9BACT|nr:cob(I)yrinic acid a,c-diamide adenosyltransferase [Tepiditoga spiralis]BBE31135.1 cob(I)alamin adenolsyltransferase/cobinamide ATP-dependent adenolsyltransferase [Tepiditoga spiralis]